MRPATGWIESIRRRVASSGTRALAAAEGLLGACRTMPPPAGWSPTAFALSEEALGTSVDRVRSRYNQPALAVAVVRSDGSVRRAVSGTLVLGASTPALPGHRFHIGSTTKAFTAVLAAQLVEEGRLRWDASLRDALPDVPMRDEYRAVTVHDLLMGASGLLLLQRSDLEPAEHVEFLMKALPNRGLGSLDQRREMARYILAQTPLHARGERHHYSNAAWSLLGHVLEVRAGMAYEDLVRRRIFEPLRMTSARLGGWPASSCEPEQPRGHYLNAQGLVPQALDDPYVLPAWMNPAGGIQLDIDDLAAWAGEHLRGLRGTGRLLPAAAYRRIHSVHLRVAASEMYQGMKTSEHVELGYGWVIANARGYPLSAADGSGGTFYARIAVLPSHDVAFAGVVNSGAGDPVLGASIRAMTGLPW